MKVKNLTDVPVQLGDGRMIGASGTSGDERKYGLKDLTERDQRRFEKGTLEVIKTLPADAEKTNDTEKTDGSTSKTNGGKNHVK